MVLAKGEALLDRPSADDVNRPLFERATSAQALAIQGDNLLPQRPRDGAEMLAKTLVKMGRFDEVTYIGKGLRGGNAMRQGDPFMEPIGLILAEVFDLSEVVHPAKGGGEDKRDAYPTGGGARPR